MDRLRSLLRTQWRQVLAWALIAAGAVAALIGWIGVSGKDIEPLQLPYLASGGIGGLILTAVGAALLISADVRDDRERVGRLEGEVLELQDLVRDLVDHLGAGGDGDGTAPGPAERATGSGRRRTRASAATGS
jgi:hypothetical protein